MDIFSGNVFNGYFRTWVYSAGARCCFGGPSSVCRKRAALVAVEYYDDENFRSEGNYLLGGLPPHAHRGADFPLIPDRFFGGSGPPARLREPAVFFTRHNGFNR